MEKDAKMPIILERPLLATGKVVINVKNGCLTLKVVDEEIKFDLEDTLRAQMKSY